MSNQTHSTEPERSALAVDEVPQRPMQPEPWVLAAAGVALVLDVSKRHVAALNSSGRLPRPIKLGRRTVWVADELRAWLAAGAPERSRWEELRNGGAK